MGIGGGPDYSAMMQEQMEMNKKAQEEQRVADLADREYFTVQAEKEREEQMRRDARMSARAAREEKLRVSDLAAEEASATEEAIGQEAISDRDTGFGNMFASLLSGQQGATASGSFGSFLSSLGGMTRGTKFPSRKYD